MDIHLGIQETVEVVSDISQKDNIVQVLQKKMN